MLGSGSAAQLENRRDLQKKERAQEPELNFGDHCKESSDGNACSQIANGSCVVPAADRARIS